MVREVSVCKEAEAEVEADEADAADEAVEVSSEALLTESRLESSTLAIIRPTITTSPYGIGCFGKAALEFVDFLAEAGQTIWQILPLSPTGYGDSPYQSCSAFAGNPYFIDLDALKAEGLLTAAQLKAEEWGENPLEVDYGTLYTSRYKVLRTAYQAWREQCAGQHGCAFYDPDDYYAFTLANEAWLEDYALYMALKTEHQMKSWTDWPREYRTRDAGALARFRAAHEEEIGCVLI